MKVVNFVANVPTEIFGDLFGSVRPDDNDDIVWKLMLCSHPVLIHMLSYHFL